MNELLTGFSKQKMARESAEFAALRTSAALLDDVYLEGSAPPPPPLHPTPPHIVSEMLKWPDNLVWLQFPSISLL